MEVGAGGHERPPAVGLLLEWQTHKCESGPARTGPSSTFAGDDEPTRLSELIDRRKVYWNLWDFAIRFGVDSSLTKL